MIRQLTILASISCLQVGAMPALPAAGETHLTISEAEPASPPLALSLAELAALPQVTVATETEFTDGLVRFRGPLAREVLALGGLGAAETVRFVAANDYWIDIPFSDLCRYDVILAMEADGRPLSLRDKGPLWLIYPISDHPELGSRIYSARLIWQVVAVERP